MKLEKVEYPYSTLYNKAYITTNDEGRKLVIFVENGKSVKGTPVDVIYVKKQNLIIQKIIIKDIQKNVKKEIKNGVKILFKT